MVKSPATAATMAYPTEEEKLLYRRMSDTNGNDDDDDGDSDDDVVRNTGNREKRSCNRGACRVCDFRNDTNDDLEQFSNNHNRRHDVNDAKFNNTFMSSCLASLCNNLISRMLQNALRENNQEPLPGSSRCNDQEEKENMKQPKNNRRRKRKSSIPTHVLWHQDGSVSGNIRMIPALGYRPKSDEEKTETVLNAKYGKKHIMYEYDKKHRQNEKEVMRRGMFKCFLCPRVSPARALIRRAYHTKTSLILHKLWRHKRRSSLVKKNGSDLSANSLLLTASKFTIKATFFTPNYRYHR